MIALSHLLGLDAPDCVQRSALPLLLGDSYLYCENSVFRNVRDLALYAGFRFEDQCTELWKSYTCLPLLHLDRILAERSIPYIDNVSVLRSLLVQYGDFGLPFPLLKLSLRRSFVLHESAHAVSAGHLDSFRHPFLDALSSKEAFVVKSVLCEAYANTVERLGFVEADSPTHSLFFALHSYVPPNKPQIEQLRRCIDSYGFHCVFRFVYAMHYLSNWGIDASPRADKENFLRRLEPNFDEVGIAAFSSLAATGVRVNPAFRDETTPTYFEMHRCKQEFEDLSRGVAVSESAEALIFAMADDLARRTESGPKRLNGYAVLESPDTHSAGSEICGRNI